ncbi:deoxycytidine deaminase [Wohlfahrtiimonas chitiniclastica]|uniref:dCTP deaminase n=1 Tax=Wohlfahrtiimonas chitiniclastica TaxID=400946 RepID=UPI000B998D69|nr:deoxycytidine deaminase [Wohlfahrtiimonas chitiniclastica]OYQ77504.1 deoxycytidine deaminase [Wohlfahrtiimonas chitiniclastica]
MILTGSKIKSEHMKGNIEIIPFNAKQCNPNSYNYLLGDTLKEYVGKDQNNRNIFKEINIPMDGIILFPGKMYLGMTYESIGSKKYAMSLIGRSSLGRYGLFLQISADLGHTTSSHHWTLELYACLPIRVYPKMPIGQVSFWNNHGVISCLGKTFALYNKPMESYIS